MEIDPVVGTLVGAIVTLAGLLYRNLLMQLDEEKEESRYWRDRALEGTGLAEIATEQAERTAPPKRRSR